MGYRMRMGVACVAAISIVAGCITQQDRKARFTREGVQYGVTEGTFRGRWWNYYERGRSFGDGAFWAEAERDFRAALAGRARDQLWPRTYGLHFIPEYFPHRELGIALHHQDRHQEAIAELEVSLKQTDSARARYFLDEARKALIRSEGSDRAEPTIEILSPEAGAPLDTTSLQVVGIARDDTYVAGIQVNGKHAMIRGAAPEVRFVQAVDLLPGANEVQVSVTDLAGKTATQSLSLRADVDGPTLSFDRPLTIPGAVRGVAMDASGVSRVLIAGKEAALTPEGDGQTRFEVALAQQDIQGPIRYELADGLNNVTAGEVLPETLQAGQLPTGAVPAALRHVELGRGLTAWVFGGQPIVIAKAPETVSPGEPPVVRFLSVRDGQRFFMDEVVVSVDVAAAAPLRKVEINGVEVAAIPGRAVQTVSRRIRLEPGTNRVRATATDADGKECPESAVEIRREQTAIESPVSRLQLAVLGSVWKGNSPTLENEAGVIVSELQDELDSLDRFRLVDRSDLMAEALQEQLLSAALASKESRLNLGRWVAAEVMAVGRVRKDFDGTIEIVLEAVSTETALIIARADVAGPAQRLEQLTQLVQDLALRVTQEFPSRENRGEVTRLRGMADVPVALNLGVLGDTLREKNPFGSGGADLFLSEFRRELMLTGQFSVADRGSLDAIEAEQALSETLAGSDTSLVENRTVPADLLIEITAVELGGQATVSLEAVDPQTTERLKRLEVSGASAGPDAIVGLARDLARQAVADLPRPEGASATAPSAQGVVTSLGRKDGIRESMKVVVFRDGAELVDPITKQVIGHDTQIVGEALVRVVQDGESIAEVRVPETGFRAAPMQPGDYVVAK